MCNFNENNHVELISLLCSAGAFGFRFGCILDPFSVRIGFVRFAFVSCWCRFRFVFAFSFSHPRQPSDARSNRNKNSIVSRVIPNWPRFAPSFVRLVSMQTTVYNSFLQLPCRPIFTTRFCSFHADHCLQLVFATSVQTTIYNTLLQLPCKPLFATSFCKFDANPYLQLAFATSMQTTTYNSLLQLPCRPLLQIVFAASMQTTITNRFCSFNADHYLQLVFATSIHSCKVWEREGVSFSLSEAARYLMPFPYDLDGSDTNAISWIELGLL